MSTITISLPSQITKRVDSEAKKQGFATRSEFIRNILRKYFIEEELKLEEFEPVPLNKLRAEFTKTGKYSEKFIDSIIKGFEKSSIYAK